MKFTSGNGWSFDSEDQGTPICNNYAKQLGLKGVTVWAATAPDGKSKEYAIFDGQAPIFSAQSLEAVGAHLDIMALGRFGTHPDTSMMFGSAKETAEMILKNQQTKLKDHAKEPKQ